MRYLESGDHESSARCVPGLSQRLTDVRCDTHAVTEEVWRRISPPVDFLSWDDQYMAGCYRCDAEKGHGLLVLPDEPSRQFSVDNLGEHAHPVALSQCWPMPVPASA